MGGSVSSGGGERADVVFTEVVRLVPGGTPEYPEQPGVDADLPEHHTQFIVASPLPPTLGKVFRRLPGGLWRSMVAEHSVIDNHI